MMVNIVLPYFLAFIVMANFHEISSFNKHIVWSEEILLHSRPKREFWVWYEFCFDMKANKYYHKKEPEESADTNKEQKI